ncbi:hypothetical protein BDM02DRAFT_2340052 [Thelephora ganbajun]|uniref:Uncharacterized protein n=1 Tax=Thelephora ganbajun TaxID=370292 RepID=A0ACB6YY37_THEGA|nr:hypothetical protein BDM02DRAFT_2340052 [Thelephora ganbajun]
MPWFKKSKKSRQPSQQPIPLGIPTLSISADMASDIGPEAVNDGRGSRVAFRDRGEDRRLDASGASTPTHGREDDLTRGYILLQLMGLISTILIVLREREHERQVPSNAPNEKFSHNAPDLSSAERQSKVRNRVECEDQGRVVEQPPEAPPERISKDDHIGKGAYDTVRSGGSGGECRYPGSILAWVDLY